MASAQKHILRNIVDQQKLYSGKILDLRIDHVRFPSGSEKIREVVEHKSAAAVLPVDSEGYVYLVLQYRHAVDEELYEIPAGIIEPGEDPLETAIRELQEEIGYKPGRIEKVLDFYPSPGYSTEKILIYYATDLSPSKLPEDEDEQISVFKFTPENINSMIRSGKISDGKTITAACWYAAKRAEDNVCC
jgi:ADP-ribose pyrophosphatase